MTTEPTCEDCGTTNGVRDDWCLPKLNLTQAIAYLEGCAENEERAQSDTPTLRLVVYDKNESVLYYTTPDSEFAADLLVTIRRFRWTLLFTITGA